MKKTRGIDLVIPVYKNAEMTRECLASIYQHLEEIDSCDPHVIAVNDSPDEADVQTVLGAFDREHSNFTLLTNPINAGFLASVNRATASAVRAGRDVILINSDTLTYPGTLAEIIKTAYADPMIGFVSPRSNNAAFCSLPLDYNGPLAATPQEAHTRWRLLSATLPSFHITPTAVGFYFFIKHNILANFGGLREDFGVGYEEENELASRANRAGYKAALANHAFAYHHGSASFNLQPLDLPALQKANLAKHKALNPEFLPRMHRYFDSAHYRAEQRLSALLPNSAGQTSMVFDLADAVCKWTEANEVACRLVRSLCRRHTGSFAISVSCSADFFKFHGLDSVKGLTRRDPNDTGSHGIAVRPSPALNQGHVDRLESLGVVNVYGMPDTLADDCGLSSLNQNLEDVWRHVAAYAHGLFFVSRFSEQLFRTRFELRGDGRAFTRLLPTRVASYRSSTKAATAPTHGKHVLVLGTPCFAQAIVGTAKTLSDTFPSLPVVVLGAEGTDQPNLTWHPADSLTAAQREALFANACLVVVPAHAEGFSLGLMQALAAGKPVVARDTPAAREVLASYTSHRGIHLFENDRDIGKTAQRALRDEASTIDDAAADGWDEWSDGFAGYCSGLVTQPGLFHHLRERTRASDELKASKRPVALTTAPEVHLEQQSQPSAPMPANTTVASLDALLALEGKAFLDMAYRTFLLRAPDPDGERDFLEKLASGTAKTEVLRLIRTSLEGQAVGAELPGYFHGDEAKATAGQRLIVVLGMHRSGTSAITRGLNVLGVELGDRLFPPSTNDENPKGYFEDEDFHNLNTEILHSVNSDWNQVDAIDQGKVDRIIGSGFFSQAVKLVRSKTHGQHLYGLKDPRIAKLIIFWKTVFRHCAIDTSYLIAIRNPVSVASSLHKRNAIPTGQSHKLWAEHTLNSVVSTHGEKRALVDYDQLLAAPKSTLQMVGGRLGLRIDEAALDEYGSRFLDKNLRHTQYSINQLSINPDCPPLATEIYAELLEVANDNELLDSQRCVENAERWRRQYSEAAAR